MDALDRFEPPAKLQVVLANLCLHRRHDGPNPVVGVAIGDIIDMLDPCRDRFEEPASART
jgi:hypothetical protein